MRGAVSADLRRGREEKPGMVMKIYEYKALILPISLNLSNFLLTGREGLDKITIPGHSCPSALVPSR